MYREYYTVTYKINGLDEELSVNCANDEELEVVIDHFKRSYVYCDVKIYKTLETSELLYELEE